jgi:tripartite-type tricarboxylate transporter receptor subunit TctC
MTPSGGCRFKSVFLALALVKVLGEGKMFLKAPALLVSYAAIASVATSAVSHAADFYQGKTVTVIVGFSPGGGYDAYARLLAQYIGKYIPGSPSVIVQNMPSAGSQTAVRSLEAAEPTDGTVIVIFNPGLIIQSIVQPNVVQLDFRKLAWVGVATPDFRVCYGYGTTGLKSWDDLLRMKQFILGSTAKGAGNYINGQELKLLGANVKEILGYPGSAEQRIAIEQGALDGDCGSFSSIPVSWIPDKKAHIFVRFTKTRPSFEPETAKFIEDYAKTEDQKKLIGFLDAVNEVGRPFVMSSEVPPDRLAIIRKAFDEAMKDPTLIAQADKEEIPVAPISGSRADKIVSDEVASAPASIIKQAVEIYQ